MDYLIKEVIEGANQVAGDWGHHALPYPTVEEINSKIKCTLPTCGRPLCAEQFISGAGFAKNFNLKHNTNYKAPEIVDLDKKGDSKANNEFELYEDRFARLIAVMIGILILKQLFWVEECLIQKDYIKTYLI